MENLHVCRGTTHAVDPQMDYHVFAQGLHMSYDEFMC